MSASIDFSSSLHTALHQSAPAKLDSPSAVPSLSYSPAPTDRWRGSAGSTPVDSPLTPTSPLPSRREKDLYLSWFRKQPSTAGWNPPDAFIDNDELLYPGLDNSASLFYPYSPEAMIASTPPIDITPPARYGSSSPRGQTSNLTSALQQAAAYPESSSAISITDRNSREPTSNVPRDESGPNGHGLSQYSNGAQPIAMAERPRKESWAGSLVNGSWGGVSVGSWIRDDIVMGGTSPYTFQSPSFHSSSYLPKMEANFMKDYVCCGLQLDSLHELLQHYEQAHAASGSGMLPRTSNSTQGGVPSANGNGATQNIGNMPPPQINQAEALNTQFGFNPPSNMQASLGHNFANQFENQQNGGNGMHGPGLDEVDPLDMEMDDSASGSHLQQQRSMQQSQQQLSGQGQPRLAPLNMNLANAFQHQGLRSSTPTTPQATSQAFTMQHNPTVSSVNTPTLASFQQQNRHTPDSSHSGTPDQPDQDFGNLYSHIGMNAQYPQGLDNFDGLGMNNVGTGLDESEQQFIDQPAKRLYSRTGGQSTNDPRVNSTELAKLMRERQMAAGLPGTGAPLAFPGEEHKPFRCPVIGCEKAYKNQNGLKYHKQHGHQNQQLKSNEDGTFSIVDPMTSKPYPGTLGMEKEKPYRCEVCHKRYKNLNGLKYHRQHSPPCNPDLKVNSTVPGAATTINSGMGGMGINVAGAGLLGMSETMVGMNDSGVF
ncbi:MAG: Transcriptional regulator of ribosomal biogenesis proteins [Bathelium mastoideum]|nr:MAG: Transcriptional regulator of ribosomal biogenesis proteins [Bathelium mastoideum]